MPLEDILRRVNFHTKGRPHRSRGYSGYSASRDDATNPGDHGNIELNCNHDLEVGLDLENLKRTPGKDIIILPGDLIDTNSNTGEMVNVSKIRKWFGKFKSLFFLLLIFALLGISFRTGYLEVQVASYKNEKHDMRVAYNRLTKDYKELQHKYDKCSAENVIDVLDPSANANVGSQISYHAP